MAITVNEVTKVIDILQADLTFISGTLYEFDTEQFHLDLREWEHSTEGSWRSITHNHNPEVPIAGVTLARVITIVNGYSVTFEDTGAAYTIRFINSNNDIFDLDSGNMNPTPLTTIVPQNSAGLIIDPGADADTVWGALLADHVIANSFGQFVQKLLSVGKFLGLK